jgi:hypothetical protein
MQMVEDVDTGKVRTYSMDEVMERVKDTLETDHSEDDCGSEDV